MSPEDIARCQQAIDLANAGQHHVAYIQFNALYKQGYTEDITLLYWIAYTTPSAEEAYRAVWSISHLEPAHPKLQELRKYVDQKQQRAAQGPSLQCPYCYYFGSARVKRKVSVAGWIWFSAFFLLFLCCLLALVPATQVQTMECTAFFFLAMGIIGLFIIKKRSYTCGSCGIALGDI
jgi:hypothetical protein